jgi:hypothetical protein
MKRGLVFLSLVAGCSSSHPKPLQNANATPDPTTTAAQQPDVVAHAAQPPEGVPADLAALEPKAKLQAGPFAWPAGGTSAVVSTDTDQVKLLWKVGAQTGSSYLPREVTRGVLHDVTKDGQPELVLFAKPLPKPPEWFEDQTSAWIVGLGPDKKPARMWRLELEVLGATDEASLDREGATLVSFGATATTPLVRTIARLPLATPAELQALVGPQGVKLCERQAEKRKCTSATQKSIDAKRAKQIVDRAGLIGEFAPGDDADPPVEVLQPPACEVDEKNPKRVICTATIGGPAGGSWIFEKTQTGMRLAEVWAWAEDS